jgi:hypothetical protein
MNKKLNNCYTCPVESRGNHDSHTSWLHSDNPFSYLVLYALHDIDIDLDIDMQTGYTTSC